MACQPGAAALPGPSPTRGQNTGGVYYPACGSSAVSVSLMEREIDLQAEYLGEFKAPDPLPGDALERALFTGSGDSLAAAMLAEAHSSLVARAADPLDIVKDGGMLDRRLLYVVSISGRTVSNIRAASLAKNATAITAEPASRLGLACGSVIPLRFPSSGRLTAGTISFLASALCCMSLVGRVRIGRYKGILDDAGRQSGDADIRGRLFVLGNLQTYPLAVYTVAKMYEVLGYSASYQRIEQFSHMDLFSARAGDTVMILEPPASGNRRLVDALGDAGLHVVQPRAPSDGSVAQFLFYTFFAQKLSSGMARARGQKECHFVTAGPLLDASSAMIY